MWCWHQHQWHHMTKKSYCTSLWLSCLRDGAIDSAVSVMWHQCQCKWWHMTKMSCWTTFQWFSLNELMPLTMSSASHDTNADAICVTWPRKSQYTSFLSSWPKECNGAIVNTSSTTWCWCCANGIQWLTSFQSSRSKEYKGIIDNTVSIMWCQC